MTTKKLVTPGTKVFEATQKYDNFYKIDYNTHIIFEDDDPREYITWLFNQLTEKAFIKIIGADTLANWARENYSLDATTADLGAYSYSEWLNQVVEIYKSSLFPVKLNNNMIDELGFQRDFRDDFMMAEIDTLLQAVLEELKGA